MLAGGIVGGLVGPESTRCTRDLFATPFLGSFVVLAAFALVALAVQSRVRVPPPSLEERTGGGTAAVARSSRQPVFIVAVLAGALGYGLMNLLMTATPIAMDFCGHPFGAAALVIEWHVVGMYAPGFFTGSLIRRFGVLNDHPGRRRADGGRASSSRSTAITSRISSRRWCCVGVGWNFMYTGGTTLLTETYAPGEKARTQGAERLHRVRDDGRVVARVRRAGVDERAGRR